ncbi:hypothetical protein GcM1_220050b [Golovinomyces cichoracearum]|uniref:Uncharacterized protein n=1 Tax=Golovinomyces cichoracearum TaxID=62708 RepID=A0A420IS34_9PEZI|nr:hypothetical protein GcM1_220050b [Golovinomyces cichoracearum]
MNVADGTSAQLTHYFEFEIGVLGVWRKVEAFVRPFSSENIDDMHLIWGIPWLHEFNAIKRRKKSIIEIGDPERGERVIKLQGPEFMTSEHHKLVLYPRDKPKNFVSLYQRNSSDDEPAESESEFEDSSDEPSGELNRSKQVDKRRKHLANYCSGLKLDNESNAEALYARESSNLIKNNDAGPSCFMPGSKIENESMQVRNNDKEKVLKYPVER